jgi:hypothetical protein
MEETSDAYLLCSWTRILKRLCTVTFSRVLPSWGDVFVITIDFDLPEWWSAVPKEHSVPSHFILEKNVSFCYAHVLRYWYYFV